MATTKKTSTRRTTRARTTTPRAKTTTTTTTAKKQSLAGRTGKAISDRPVASAAIGTGLIAGIAAAAAGFFAFKKSGKTFPEFRDDVTATVKDKAATASTKIKETATDASTFVKDGIADAKTKADDFIERRKDGVSERTTEKTSA